LAVGFATGNTDVAVTAAAMDVKEQSQGLAKKMRRGVNPSE
jgi:hypothetical protein